jgi:hypothetical protein
MEARVIVYLASPNTQQQAEHACDMPVLLSFAVWSGWMDRYQHTFSRLLIDSGAYTEHTTGKRIDIGAYRDWSSRWIEHADAVAGLDDISGDWRRSLENYEAVPHGFPTYHETDPPELLSDLCAMAGERGRWLGLGMLPETRQRRGGEGWLRETLSAVPEGLHVHLWAGRAYTKFRRIDSVDSTNWWRDAMQLRTLPDTSHLTYGECLEIVVKKYQRWGRTVERKDAQELLFN